MFFVKEITVFCIFFTLYWQAIFGAPESGIYGLANRNVGVTDNIATNSPPEKFLESGNPLESLSLSTTENSVDPESVTEGEDHLHGSRVFALAADNEIPDDSEPEEDEKDLEDRSLHIKSNVEELAGDNYHLFGSRSLKEADSSDKVADSGDDHIYSSRSLEKVDTSDWINHIGGTFAEILKDRKTAEAVAKIITIIKEAAEDPQVLKSVYWTERRMNKFLMSNNSPQDAEKYKNSTEEHYNNPQTGEHIQWNANLAETFLRDPHFKEPVDKMRSSTVILINDENVKEVINEKFEVLGRLLGIPPSPQYTLNQ